MSDKIRVLVVEDSTFMREALKSALNSDPSIEVIGEACNGKEGMDKAFALKPDVITMDLKMPIMTGIEAIGRIMEEMPTPIIIVSSMDVKIIIKALAIGAMDFVPVTQEADEITTDLIDKVKVASRVRPIRRMKMRPVRETMRVNKGIQAKILAIGVSTGGPQALQVIFSRLPQNLPFGVLVVQHISAGFIDGLVEWLSTNSSLDIQVAKSGDILKEGMVLFAPDNYNMTVSERGRISLKEDVTKKMLHVPSIDEMMMSVANSFGESAIGVIMTGMGKDGVEGIRQINKAGGITIAQDERSSAIFGMNKIAIEKGCISKVVPLEKIADEIMKGCGYG